MAIARKTLLGAGNVRVPALIDLLEAVLNLVLSLILIQFFGVQGVAWGTLVPLVIIEMFVLLPYAAGEFRVPVRDLVFDVISPAVLPLLALLGYCEATSRLDLPVNWISLLCVTAGGGIVLGAVLGATQLIKSGWAGSKQKVMVS
jgi:O-antigen/teichoic acid export membrane protein